MNDRVMESSTGFSGEFASEPVTLLVVEDEPILREVLSDNLHEAGFQTEGADNGEDAWSLLLRHPQRYSAILLDRRMPGVDGLEILKRIRADPVLTHIPVIMQTAMTGQDDVLDGLRAGAHYYLTKPFTPETLLAIVDTAVRDYRHARALQAEAALANQTLRHLSQAEFRFSTPAEARDIATLLSHTCPDPQKAVLGLSELMLNAIEHGNLGISYREKTMLIDHERLQEEIALRLDNPRYGGRLATVHFERAEDGFRFLIRDEGEGFEWQAYLEIDPNRAFDNHGRGIAMARLISFDHLEYRGRGNEVLAVVLHTPVSHPAGHHTPGP